MDLLGELSSEFLSGRKASIDSRTVLPGEVFFCLKGEKVDGHDFLGEVKSKGAFAAVVERGFSGDSFGLPLIKVEDPLKALQEVAAKVQFQRKTRIVAITGSVGKTTTKDFVHQLLSYKFRCGKSPGNSNSQVGVPLTILNHLTDEDEVAVLEMGMSHAGEIARLVQIAPPEVAVITTVDLVHAAHFDSLDAIARAKGEILSHPDTKGVILGPSSARFKWGFVPATHAVPDKIVGLLVNLPDHFKENLACAQEVARFMGYSKEEVALATQAIKFPENRFHTTFKKGVCIVDDSYNASEPSMIAAIKALPDASQRGGKVVAVLGEMLELGSFSEECHRRVAEQAVKRIDHLMLVGKGCFPLQKLFEQEGKPVSIFDQEKDFIAEISNELKKVVRPGDVVLLKGSRFWRLDCLKEAL